MLQEKQGDLVTAAALFEQAVECLNRARELSRDALGTAQFLAQTLQNYAGVLHALNRCDDALRITLKRSSLGP